MAYNIVNIYFFYTTCLQLSQYLLVTKWLSIGKPHVSKLINAAEPHATLHKIEILKRSLKIEDALSIVGRQKSKSQNNK